MVRRLTGTSRDSFQDLACEFRVRHDENLSANEISLAADASNSVAMVCLGGINASSRNLAHLVNSVDPDKIVLGGWLSTSSDRIARFPR
jgi:hypothetical protein